MRIRMSSMRRARRGTAGAPAGPLPHGDVNQAAAKKIHTNSQAQPGDTVKATGLMTHALLTQLALMGAELRALVGCIFMRQTACSLIDYRRRGISAKFAA